MAREYPDSTEDQWDQGEFGFISLNTEYTISLSYDGNKTFTFSFEDQTITVEGPPRLDDPVNLTPVGKKVGVAIVGGSSAGAITGTIDDVYIK